MILLILITKYTAVLSAVRSSATMWTQSCENVKNNVKNALNNTFIINKTIKFSWGLQVVPNCLQIELIPKLQDKKTS